VISPGRSKTDLRRGEVHRTADDAISEAEQDFLFAQELPSASHPERSEPKASAVEGPGEAAVRLPLRKVS